MARVLKPSGSMFINLGDKFGGAGGRNQSGIIANEKDRSEHGPTSYRKGKSMVRSKCKMLLPHRYAIGCIDILDLICRGDICWSKINSMPDTVTDRVRNTHEYFFHFTKEERYYSAMDELRTISNGEIDDNGNQLLGALPGSVWPISSEALKVPEGYQKHWAAFPTEWPRRLILGWSPPSICLECGAGRRVVTEKTFIQTGEAHRAGAARRDLRQPDGHDSGFNKDGYPTGYWRVNILGYDCPCTPAEDGKLPAKLPPGRPAVVLDPFGGTGTTAMVARALGRYGLSVDLSADYLKLARWRIWESPSVQNVYKRTEGGRQGGLF